eukprot:Nk52_evm30s248 gene=Nk52_evmTU30s248
MKVTLKLVILTALIASISAVDLECNSSLAQNDVEALSKSVTAFLSAAAQSWSQFSLPDGYTNSGSPDHFTASNKVAPGKLTVPNFNYTAYCNKVGPQAKDIFNVLESKQCIKNEPAWAKWVSSADTESVYDTISSDSYTPCYISLSEGLKHAAFSAVMCNDDLYSKYGQAVFLSDSRVVSTATVGSYNMDMIELNDSETTTAVCNDNNFLATYVNSGSGKAKFNILNLSYGLSSLLPNCDLSPVKNGFEGPQKWLKGTMDQSRGAVYSVCSKQGKSNVGDSNILVPSLTVVISTLSFMLL